MGGKSDVSGKCGVGGKSDVSGKCDVGGTSDVSGKCGVGGTSDVSGKYGVDVIDSILMRTKLSKVIDMMSVAICDRCLAQSRKIHTLILEILQRRTYFSALVKGREPFARVTNLFLKFDY